MFKKSITVIVTIFFLFLPVSVSAQSVSSQLNTLQEAVTEISQRLDSAAQADNTKNSQVKDSQLSQCTPDKLSNLREKNESLRKEVENLNNKKDKLEDQVNNLKQRNASLEDRILDLTSQQEDVPAEQSPEESVDVRENEEDQPNKTEDSTECAEAVQIQESDSGVFTLIEPQPRSQPGC